MKKTILLSVIGAAVIAGCGKSRGDVSPDSVNETNIDLNKNPGFASGVATSDVKVAPVPYQTPVQNVVISQNNDQLKLLYYQKISLLVDAATYHNSWGITLKQDFTPSVLGGFTYTNTNIEGDVTQDWATINLNEVNKSTKDTVVNGVNMVKIYFERNFNFTKTYASATEAAAQIPLIVQRQDQVSFVTNYEPQADASRKNTFNLQIAYSTAGGAKQ
ncbi:hypothetical protein GCM10027037_14480 [Mucilaginibacter koreensis]